MSQIIVALGTISDEDLITSSSTSPSSVIHLTTKEAVTQHRNSIPPNSIETLVFWIQAHEIASVYDPMELAGWVPLLIHDNGNLAPSTSISDPTTSIPTSQVEFQILGDDSVSLAPIHTSLLLAGLKATLEQKESNLRRLTARRHDVTVTVSQPISLPARTDDFDDGDLIDEDDLLNDTTLGVPTLEPRTVNPGDDCSGRKPCDNCTCGRAEAESAGNNSSYNVPALTKEKLVQKTSACGNCAKGDAFRCASCPFLGKPAFKAGQEHLVLDLMDDL